MDYFKRLFDWIFRRAWFVWGFSLLLLVCFLFDVESDLKVYALILQIIGGLMVVISLEDKILALRGRTFVEHAKQSFIEFVNTFPKRKVMTHVRIEASLPSMTTSGRVRSYAKPKKDFDSIIKYMNDQISDVYSVVDKENAELKRKIRELEHLFNDSEKSLKIEIQETKTLLDATIASNVWQDLFGVLVLILGSFVSSFPETFL
jgi:hypothetical protein